MKGGNNMKASICSIVGTIGSTIAYFLGGWDSSIQTLLLFMLIDYITGLVVAGVFHKSKKTETGTIESRQCYKGLIKKCTIILFVVIANRLDMQLDSSYIRDAVCIAFMTNELISIIENAGLMGIPIPKIIINAIDILKRKDEEYGKSIS